MIVLIVLFVLDVIIALIVLVEFWSDFLGLVDYELCQKWHMVPELAIRCHNAIG